MAICFSIMHRRSYCWWCFVPFLLCSELIVVGGAFSKLYWQRQQSSPSSLLFSRTTADYNDAEDLVSSRTSNAPTDQAARRETVTGNLEATNAPYWKRLLPDPLCSRPFLERIDLRARSSTLCHTLYSSGEDSEDEDPVFAHVYLLGTSHVSSISCQDSSMLLEHVDPDVVFLELCHQRMAWFLTKWATTPRHLPNGTSDNDDETARQGNPKYNYSAILEEAQNIQDQEGHSFSLSVYLATEATKMNALADALGAEVGGEFRAAYQYSLAKAEQLREQRRNIHVVLGDRPFHLTWRRASEVLNWWARTRLHFFMVRNKPFSDVSDKDLGKGINSMIESGKSDRQKKYDADLKKHFPSYVEAIIDERDAYMACKLYQAAEHYAIQKLRDDMAQFFEQEEHSSLFSYAKSFQANRKKKLTMVAIVGANHVQGMVKWFSDGKMRQPPEEVLRELVQTKSVRRKKRWWRRLWSRKDESPQQQQLVDQGEDSLSEEECFLVNGHLSLQLL